MKFILGKKIEMTQKYREDGKVIPVTKIFVEPCVITQVKTQEHEGYSAVQVGAFKRKHFNKPLAGHLKDINAGFIKEFRIMPQEEKNFQVGDLIRPEVFSTGEIIQVTGTSKGKGFQGVVKRWGFSGQPSTHGHKDQARMPGSSGAGGPQHVFKGKKMGGRMGGDQITIKNLEIIEVDPKNSIVY